MAIYLFSFSLSKIVYYNLGNLYSNSVSKHKPELGGESIGFMQSNNLPHLMNMDSKEDAFCVSFVNIILGWNIYPYQGRNIFYKL